MRARIVWLVATVAVVAAGCTTRYGDLTVGSTKNIPADLEILRENVVGRDCSHNILGLFTFGVQNPTIDGALDNAIEQVKGADALSDAALYWDRVITIIYNRACVRVEGTAIRTRGTAASGTATN